MSIQVSIITVCYNCVSNIEDTVKSIIPFVNTNVEYVVVDGGSYDGTKEILNGYKDNISIMVSEKDNGIYDAMNKAISKSHGQWCLFINAGDKLLNIPAILLSNKLNIYDAVFCPVVSENGIEIHPSFNWRIKYKNTIPHQGAFYNIRKNNIHFDTKYKVFSDYDLNLRLFKSNCSVYILPNIISFHSSDGISQDKQYSKESYSIVRKHGGILFLFLSFLHKKKQGITIRLSKL